MKIPKSVMGYNHPLRENEISQKKLNEMIEAWHNHLLNTENVLEIIKMQFGFNLETIKKYKIGWTGIDFTYSGIRYYRNCVTIPVIDIQGKIRNIRFRRINSNTVEVNTVLNFRGLLQNITFYGNFQEGIKKYWLFENELEVIRVAQALCSVKKEGICVLCSTSRKAGIPSEWYLPSFFNKVPLVIFFSNSKVNQDKIRTIIQLFGENARIIQNRDEDIIGLFKLMGDERAIEYLLKLEGLSQCYAIEGRQRRQILNSTLIEPDKIQQINLAQDFVDGIAYYTIGLERLTEYKIRRNGHIKYTLIKEITPYIITSTGGMVEIDETITNKFRIITKFPPCLPDSTPRWSLKSIKDFIQNISNFNIEKIFDEICDLMGKCFVYSKITDLVVTACWVIGTYLFRLFAVFPTLFIYLNPEENKKESFIEIIKEICFNGWKCTICSKRDLFTILSGYSPTLLIDEKTLQDTTFGRRLIRQFIFESDGVSSTVLQLVREKRQTRMVEILVDCPKLIYGSGDLNNLNPNNLIAVKIDMIKEKPLKEELLNIRDKLYHFAMRYWQEIYQKITVDKTHLQNDKWFPLIKIAEIFGDKIVSQIESVKNQNDTAQSTTSLGIHACLKALQSMVRLPNYQGYVYTSDVARLIKQLYPNELSHISWKDTLHCLRQLGFTLSTKRTNRGYKVICPKEKIAQIIQSY